MGTICVKSKTFQDLEIMSFVDLSLCVQILCEVSLKTNNSKYEVVSFGLRQLEAVIQPVFVVDDLPLEVADSVNFLRIDTEGTNLGRLRRSHLRQDYISFVSLNLTKLCTDGVLLMAYSGVIFPHLSYGIRL